MTVLAIDPGPKQSAWVLWNNGPCAHGKDSNDVVLHRIYSGYWGAAPMFSQDGPYTHPVIYVMEQVASYGMPVGSDVFETCVWTGRFVQRADDMRPFNGRIERMPRREVKLHLCGQARAKDSNIRQALIDRFGGRDAAIGKKRTPGPLYGIKADEWQALALAVTWCDRHAPQAKEA